MTTHGKPTRRVSVSVKRTLFVGGVLWFLFHLLVLAVTFPSRIALPFIVVLFLDVVAGVVAGLVWLSRRIFPADAKGEGR